MTRDPDQPATTVDVEDIGDIQEVVAVVCGHTWFDVRLDRYMFVFQFPGTRRRFTLQHTNPVRYRLGHTYRLTLTPTPRCDHRPTGQFDPAADAA
jgi:hypothetical protein